jgi:hypothetical protein
MNEYIEKLKEMCALLRKETEGLSEEATTRRPAPDKWCIKEIVWHLADGEEEVFLIRLKRILRESRPFLHLHDQEKEAAERNYRGRNLREGVEKFCAQRQKSLDVIQSANTDDWGRMGSHETRGVVSFKDIVQTMVEHDAKHLEQIRKLKKG